MFKTIRSKAAFLSPSSTDSTSSTGSTTLPISPADDPLAFLPSIPSDPDLNSSVLGGFNNVLSTTSSPISTTSTYSVVPHDLAPSISSTSSSSDLFDEDVEEPQPVIERREGPIIIHSLSLYIYYVKQKIAGHMQEQRLLSTKELFADFDADKSLTRKQKNNKRSNGVIGLKLPDNVYIFAKFSPNFAKALLAAKKIKSNQATKYIILERLDYFKIEALNNPSHPNEKRTVILKLLLILNPSLITISPRVDDEGEIPEYASSSSNEIVIEVITGFKPSAFALRGIGKVIKLGLYFVNEKPSVSAEELFGLLYSHDLDKIEAIENALVSFNIPRLAYTEAILSRDLKKQLNKKDNLQIKYLIIEEWVKINAADITLELLQKFIISSQNYLAAFCAATLTPTITSSNEKNIITGFRPKAFKLKDGRVLDIFILKGQDFIFSSELFALEISEPERISQATKLPDSVRAKAVLSDVLKKQLGRYGEGIYYDLRKMRRATLTDAQLMTRSLIECVISSIDDYFSPPIPTPEASSSSTVPPSQGIKRTSADFLQKGIKISRTADTLHASSSVASPQSSTLSTTTLSDSEAIKSGVSAPTSRGANIYEFFYSSHQNDSSHKPLLKTPFI